MTNVYYDNQGRTTKRIENYVDGKVSDEDDKTTEFGYDGSGHMTSYKAWLNSTDYQETDYLYGVFITDDYVNSNDLLKTEEYPNKSTGAPSTSASDQVGHVYNALGQQIAMTDRNGNIHAYSFDPVGRPTADAVTTLGSGVEGSVRRVETAYDSAGRAYLFTNYDSASSGSVVNQVQRTFNGLGQLTVEYQEAGGAVNTSTSPKVQYAYDEMYGGANESRLVSMTYPNGRQLAYNYSGSDAAISRLSSIGDGTVTLEGYAYLGLDTVVTRSHPESGADLTYVGSGTGDGGDQYVGLDRFGRIVGLSVDSRGAAGLSAGAADPRAAHPPRKGHLQHLHRAGAAGGDRLDVRGLSRPRGADAYRPHRAPARGRAGGGVAQLGFALASEDFFDTVTVGCRRQAETRSSSRALEEKINLRIGDGTLGIALDETTTPEIVEAVWRAFGGKLSYADVEARRRETLPPESEARQRFLTHPVFHAHRSETELLRYMRKLSDRDLALDRAMIPLGSCTMKLNATTRNDPADLAGVRQPCIRSRPPSRPRAITRCSRGSSNGCATSPAMTRSRCSRIPARRANMPGCSRSAPITPRAASRIARSA